jgi:hypothetical protein
MTPQIRNQRIKATFDESAVSYLTLAEKFEHFREERAAMPQNTVELFQHSLVKLLAR